MKTTMNKIINGIRKQPPGRLITGGFALVILLGALILLLPVSVKDGAVVKPIDALFTSTSAVCVTGLIAIDTADHFTPFGQAVVAALIQIGGLGVTSVGVGFMLAIRKRVSMKTRMMVSEALNINSYRGMVRLVKAVLLTTLCFEGAGAILSFLVFVQDYSPLHAAGISIFHSIAAFNNSGFDILGGLRNLIPYRDNVLLNMITCVLIIFGGLGFLVIRDILSHRKFKKLMLHSKIVITTTAALLIIGTLLLKATEDISWMGAFFHSVSARTAGFSTYPIGDFTNAGLFVLCILMFVGASPGSTIQEARAMFNKKQVSAFRRGIAKGTVTSASIITLLSMAVVCIGTFLLCVLDPEFTFIQVLFEVVSAFGTVGLSTGITPTLSVASKMVIIIIMFIGRLGAVTLLSMWIDHPVPRAHYTEETVSIG